MPGIRHEMMLPCGAAGRRRIGGSIGTESNHENWLLTQVGISPGCMDLSRDWESRQRARLLAYKSLITQVLLFFKGED